MRPELPANSRSTAQSIMHHCPSTESRITSSPQSSGSLSRRERIWGIFLPEVLVSHVCRRWRTVATSMASLWSFFCCRWDGYRRSIPIGRLKAYLERSKEHPLDLWFQPPDYGKPVNNRFRDKALPLIMSHSHRWRRFQIMTTNEETAEKLSACLQQLSTAPALEALIPILTGYDHYANENPGEDTTMLSGWSPNTALSGAPKLQFLQLDEISVRFFRPPLQSIVHFRLEIHQELSLISFSCSTLDHILALPHLETLSIWGDYINFTPESFSARTSVIEAKKLKHFRSDGNVLPYCFLSHVAAPSLETFRVYNPGRSKHGYTNTTPRFPSLHTVCLHALIPHSPNISGVMELLPLMSMTTTLVMSNLSSAIASELKGYGTLQCVEEVTIREANLQTVLDLVSVFPRLRDSASHLTSPVSFLT